jgi:hypothetical protein
MKWLLVIITANVSGHTQLSNSSWLDAPAYISLEQCQADAPRLMALHPNAGGGPALWECLAVDPLQSRTLVPYANGDWK